MRPCSHLSFLSRSHVGQWLSLIILDLLFHPCLADLRVPQPIVATTGSTFLGYDGAWSPVNIRVGTPQQYVSLLPSTLSQETWVVGPAGCDGTSACTNQRGGLFSANQSTTFQERGPYELNSHDTGFGYYGMDTIYLSDDVSTADQIVALVNSTEHWIGSLGLGVQQTRFDGTENHLPLLSSLVQNGSFIPSHSYGYTAGAFYRLKSVPASLTLGGVDANRFIPNNMTFTLRTDYAPVVAINSISVSANPPNDASLPVNWNSNPVSLSDSFQADTFTIDSSTPFLWLPEAICDNFAQALNLTYNDTLQLYLYNNDSSPNDLKSWNLTFTFAIGNLPGSSSNLDLTLPYDAFNLQLSYPFPNLDANFTSPPTSYFPLRKTADPTQYIIGRSFLQETYLVVDYERNNFSLSQAVFTVEAVNNVNLLSITRPENSIWPGPSVSSVTSSALSTGAKVGIAVGAVIIALLATAALWYFCIKKKCPVGDEANEHPKKRSLFTRLHLAPSPKTSVSELLGDKRHPTEVPADSSATRFEMAAVEDVSSTYFQRDKAIARNDPRDPAELDNRDVSTKAAEAAAIAGGGSQRSASPVPPYSPADANNRFSDSISPYTPRHSHGFGTVSSGEQGISPVDGSSNGHSRQSSNSKALSSPISPEAAATRPLQDRSPRISSNGSPTNSSSGNLMVPQLNGRPLSRSPSTGSRFVEQGLTAVAEEQPASPPAALKSPGPRFSWEQ
ncbi:uncharacterized protein A1O9_10917 [Exophiala aquamarina CBS 119918]|uniref:Peptidase A1 domain-containing protein n=1 Tax=Exophiala aquamarina CBS 119918 TaxID=1182545 RepID=A0A072NYQ8_9EURO|nr:uncharacterized protein A1O9_10917 [Exophiala aquamarina CBS 119918]KEF53009.1 hypothetical protein A1O9_10917 [Exophiala aquamarina CBS 119918]